MWVDTHAHLYLKQFDDDRGDMMQRAQDEEVEHVFLPDIDSSTSDALDMMVENYKGCHAMSGLHPCSVKENFRQELEHVKRRLDQKEDIVAVGEVGLDYYWDRSFDAQQMEAFEQQIEWAREMDLPIIIHSRDSLDDTIATIERLSNGDLRGIFHCFNGSESQARRIQEVGFLVGLGGVITFKNVKLDDMIRSLSDENFVLETDSPYLSPVPFRGKRNESSYIPKIGAYIAQVRNQRIEEVARITTSNAKGLFKIEEGEGKKR